MAYELMMEGVPVPIIQQQLGHASLATTDRYLRHIAPRDVVMAMQALVNNDDEILIPSPDFPLWSAAVLWI